MLAVVDVAYIILLRMPKHPEYACKLLMLDSNGCIVHTIHYHKRFACEEQSAEDTARALCEGYKLPGYTTIE